MGRVTSGPNPLRSVGTLQLVVVVLMALVGATAAASTVAQSSDGQVVMADFQNVGPLTNQTLVKIGGVEVGTTGQPTVDAQRHVAVVALNLEQKALPLHTDATLSIQQTSLVGERYIVLNPGSPNAPILQPGQGIPASQTSLANDYQNIVQTLNDPTAAGLASVVNTLGNGISGRGQNVQDILHRWGPAFYNTTALVQSLNRQNGILGQVVDQIQPLVNGLTDNNGRTLDGTINSANSLLTTTTLNEANLRATLQELPSTLSAAQKTLGDLTDTAQSTETTLRELRPTADQLPQISKELGTFTDSANPALKAANPLLDRLNEALDEAQPLARELRTTTPQLQQAIHLARPVTTEITKDIGGPYGTQVGGKNEKEVGGDLSKADYCSSDVNSVCEAIPRLQGILGFLHDWSLVTNQGDALQHYFRVFFVASTQTLSGGVGGITGPGVNAKAVSAKASPLAQLPGAQNTVLPAQPANSTSATGLNPTQESNALGTLMGGR